MEEKTIHDHEEKQHHDNGIEVFSVMRAPLHGPRVGHLPPLENIKQETEKEESHRHGHHKHHHHHHHHHHYHKKAENLNVTVSHDQLEQQSSKRAELTQKTISTNATTTEDSNVQATSSTKKVKRRKMHPPELSPPAGVRRVAVILNGASSTDDEQEAREVDTSKEKMGTNIEIDEAMINRITDETALEMQELHKDSIEEQQKGFKEKKSFKFQEPLNVEECKNIAEYRILEKFPTGALTANSAHLQCHLPNADEVEECSVQSMEEEQNKRKVMLKGPKLRDAYLKGINMEEMIQRKSSDVGRERYGSLQGIRLRKGPNRVHPVFSENEVGPDPENHPVQQDIVAKTIQSATVKSDHPTRSVAWSKAPIGETLSDDLNAKEAEGTLPTGDTNGIPESKIEREIDTNVSVSSSFVVRSPIRGSISQIREQIVKTKRMSLVKMNRTQMTIHNLLEKPHETFWGRVVHRVICVCIILNVIAMAAETADGTNHRGSSPDYPFLPSAETYDFIDLIFTVIFSVEFVGRLFAKRFRFRMIKDPMFWMDVLSISPYYISLAFPKDKDSDDYDKLKDHTALLRLCRIIRIVKVLRHYEESQILYHSIKASLRPLGITFFFLGTLVIVLATALFYAEPCKDVRSCPFTDIFNCSYFMMITIATVGYGNQVPSKRNPASLIITSVAMIFGNLYFAMPLAIVGNNFQTTYETFQWRKKKKMKQVDETLIQFPSCKHHSNAARIVDIQYHLHKGVRVVMINIRKMIRKSHERIPEAFKEEAIVAQGLRSQMIIDALNKLLEVHKEVCDKLDHFLLNKQRKNNADSQVQRSFHVLTDFYAKAKRAIQHNTTLSSGSSFAGNTFKGKLWLVLEVPDSSKLAKTVNRFMVTISVLSMIIFCAESMPELYQAGPSSGQCKRVVQDYCSAKGFQLKDPGCYVRGVDDWIELDFQCSDSTDRLPYWVYFEWFAGPVFIGELILRFYASHARKRFLRDIYNIFDTAAVVPFCGEVIQYIVNGVRPNYINVASTSSFFSLLRILKTTRILKLTRHFRGTKILAETAQHTWKQLTIPLFFLFAACILAGAIFFEIERGVECTVGNKTCEWMGKNILKDSLVKDLPIGKRVQIQDNKLSLMVDMVHSSWYALQTATSVGYGDMHPRTSLGMFLGIILIIFGTIYCAMPLSLVGGKFYSLYEEQMEGLLKKGSVQSRRVIKVHVDDYTAMSPDLKPKGPFKLTEKDLKVIQEFMALNKLVTHLAQNIENFNQLSKDLMMKSRYVSKDDIYGKKQHRSTEALEQTIMEKGSQLMDTIFQFAQVTNHLLEAPENYVLPTANTTAPEDAKSLHMNAVTKRERAVPGKVEGAGEGDGADHQVDPVPPPQPDSRSKNEDYS